MGKMSDNLGNNFQSDHIIRNSDVFREVINKGIIADEVERCLHEKPVYPNIGPGDKIFLISQMLIVVFLFVSCIRLYTKCDPDFDQFSADISMIADADNYYPDYRGGCSWREIVMPPDFLKWPG